MSILDHGDSLSYDYLIVAAGAGSSYFGHDDWAPHAPSLKTLDDALRVRARMLVAYERAERTTDPAERKRLLTFVLVGGGATGVEMAGAIAEIARQTLAQEFRSIHTSEARVLLIEAGPTILAPFPEPLRDAARASLARLGVEVREKTPVTRIEDGRVWLGDEMIEAGTILWTAGVTASPLGASLGVPRDRAGRVLVEPDLSVPGHPEAFVDRRHGGPGRRQGQAVPRRLAGRDAAGGPRRADDRAQHGRAAAAARSTTRTSGNMATIGRNAAIADLGWLRMAGFPAWLLWLFIHIFWLIGFRNRLTVLVQWAGAYLTYQRSVRLITRDGHSWLRAPEAGSEAPEA